MGLNLDGTLGVHKLGGSRGFLQVLLPEFTLTKKDAGVSLEVAVTDDLYAIRDSAAKWAFFDALQNQGGGAEREMIREELAQFAGNPNALSYRFNCSNCPFRYANGGVLPILRLGSEDQRDKEDYFCLFYREIFPIGWNIANGGSDNLEEMLVPERILLREFGEELFIFDQDAQIVYSFASGNLSAFRTNQFEALKKYLPVFKGVDPEKYKQLPVPLRWFRGPDQVCATVRGRRQTSEGYFLNITPEDNGIEVDRIVLITLKGKIRIVDGELLHGRPVNHIVGLFPAKDLQSKLDGSDFKPSRVFVSGVEHHWTAPDTGKVVQEAIGEQLQRREEPLQRKYEDEQNKYNLCPVTRNIIKRYYKDKDAVVEPLRPVPPGPVPPSGTSPKVFLSFRRPDVEIALALYEYLAGKEVFAFFSEVSLRDLGVSDFSKGIDNALESATCLVVIGTRPDHFDSGWVGYEWRSFVVEIRSGRKPTAQVFTLAPEEVRIDELPLGLRGYQRVLYSPASPLDSYQNLYSYLARTLHVSGRHRNSE